MELKRLNYFGAIQLLVACFLSLSNAEIKLLTESNWTDMLRGEWLVKFYAPWCPACRSLEPTWERLGQRSIDLNMKFAKIDVTENAVLSGRFFIMALPTIYHVKDGIFRQFKGQRTESDIVSFVRDETWKDVEPIPWYLSPTSIHMAAVGMFFQFSITIRDVHTVITNEYGVPAWGSYMIFAVATILIGLLLGLLVVFLCDAVNLTRPPRRAVQPNSRSPATPLATHGAVVSGGTGDEANNDEDDYDIPDDTRTKGDLKPLDSGDQSASTAGEKVSDVNVPGLADETGLRHRETTKDVHK